MARKNRVDPLALLYVLILIVFLGYQFYHYFNFITVEYSCKPSDLIHCDNFKVEGDRIILEITLKQSAIEDGLKKKVIHEFGESFYRMPNIRAWYQGTFKPFYCREIEFNQEEEKVKVIWECDGLGEVIKQKQYDNLLIEWSLSVIEEKPLDVLRVLEIEVLPALEGTNRGCFEYEKKLVCNSEIKINYWIGDQIWMN